MFCEEGLSTNQSTLFRHKSAATALTLVLMLVLSALLSTRTNAGSDDLIRVAVLRGRTSVSIASPAGFTVTDLSTGKVIGTAKPGLTWQFAPAAAGVAIASTSGQPVPEPAFFTGPLLLAQPATAAPDQFLTVGGTARYRGTLEVRKESEQALTLVNSLSIEPYLYGVVPREMPAGWQPEALKAQAVAARTYAIYTKLSGKYANLGYDLVNTDESQVYGGVGAEDPRTNAAVDQTKGLVALYNGKVIAAYFHSSSGGHTENSETVWSFALPYIRGVPDFDQDSPKFSWQSTFTMAQVTSDLAAKGINVGNVYRLEHAGQKGVSGRWSAVRVTGTEGTTEVRSEDLRRALGLNSSLIEFKPLDPHWDSVSADLGNGGPMSVIGAGGVVVDTKVGRAYALGIDGALYRPDQLTAVSSQLVPASVEIDGHGWGHGLGLSQYGANTLAQRGKSYRDIIEYYYQGSKVGSWPVAP